MASDPKALQCTGLVDPNDTCHMKCLHTDYTDNFRPPIRRSGMRTRSQHMDSFLWATLTKAYIERQLAKNKKDQSSITVSSEYTEQFHKIPLDHQLSDETLQKSYPLYGTAAVTLWCPEVCNQSPFKMVNCLTKPNSECYEQFR